MTDTPPAPPINFVDNPHAPDVFADEVTGFYIFAGVLRITLESVRVDHSTSPGPLNRVVIGQLVMPVQAAENMARGVLQFLDQQRGRQAQDQGASQTLQ